MKAISIKQPWVNMIMSGEKKFEYRSWRTDYRGDLLICSSASPKVDGMLSGYALCIVEITDVIKVDNSDYRSLGKPLPPRYTETTYAWKIENARIIKPFPVKGKLNFYYVDDELIEITETRKDEPIKYERENANRKPRIYQPRNTR